MGNVTQTKGKIKRRDALAALSVAPLAALPAVAQTERLYTEREVIELVCDATRIARQNFDNAPLDFHVKAIRKHLKERLPDGVKMHRDMFIVNGEVGTNAYWPNHKNGDTFLVFDQKTDQWRASA